MMLLMMMMMMMMIVIMIIREIMRTAACVGEILRNKNDLFKPDYNSGPRTWAFRLAGAFG